MKMPQLCLESSPLASKIKEYLLLALKMKIELLWGSHRVCERSRITKPLVVFNYINIFVSYHENILASFRRTMNFAKTPPPTKTKEFH